MLGRFSSFAKANALIALHVNISRLTYWSVTAKHKPADSTPPADQQLIHRNFFVETFLCCPLISNGETTIISFKPLQIWAQINSCIIHWAKACVYLPDLPFLTHSDWHSKNCPTQCVTRTWDVCPIFRIFLLLLHQCYIRYHWATALLPGWQLCSLQVLLYSGVPVLEYYFIQHDFLYTSWHMWLMSNKTKNKSLIK